MGKKLAVTAVIIVLALVAGLSFYFLTSGSYAELGDLRDVHKVGAAEVIDTKAQAGCQQLERRWQAFVQNPSEDLIERGINFEKSTSKLYIVGHESRAVSGNIASANYGRDNFDPNTVSLGYLITPHRYGGSMWQGLTNSGGNPNEQMTCIVEYHIEFNPHPSDHTPLNDSSDSGSGQDSGSGSDEHSSDSQSKEELPLMWIIAAIVAIVAVLVVIVLIATGGKKKRRR